MKKHVDRNRRRRWLPVIAALALLALGAGVAGADVLPEGPNPATIVAYIGCAVGVATAPTGWGLVMVLLHCGLLYYTP